MKSTLATWILGTTAVLGAGGVALTDAQIDPYVDKGDHYEMTVTNDLNQQDKVKIAKDKAEVIMEKWGGENMIKVKRIGNFTTSERALLSKTRKIETVDAKEAVLVEPVKLDTSETDNGVKVDILLNEKPTTNVFDLEIEGAEAFDFFYQPPLTEEAQGDDVCTFTECRDAEGNITSSRPENVVGSYAVYHKTKKDHRIGGTNYATGKAFHIYRPKVIDSKGNETWAELNFHGTSTLSVTVPQTFLDSAVYPVRVDPTFGYTRHGSSNFSSANILYTYPTAGISGTLTSFTIYFPFHLNNPGKVHRVILYNNSGRIDYSAEHTNDGTESNKEYQLTAQLGATISSENIYYLGAFTNDSTGSLWAFDSDTRQVNAYQSGVTYVSPPPSTWTITNSVNSRKFSIYATYTEPARSITTTDFSFCRLMTMTAGGTSGGVATTTTQGFQLVATSTIADLKATSSSGDVQKLDANRVLPADVVFGNEASCYANASITALPHYFESYASTTGAFVVWINAPDVSSTSAKTVTMYYGNSAAVDLNSPGQTFATTSALKPKSVWGLSQNPGQIGDFILDATYNYNHASSTNMDSTGSIDAIVGKGLSLDGLNDYLQTTTNYGNGSSVATFALSTWFKTSSSSGKMMATMNAAKTGTDATQDRQLYVGTDGKVYGYIYDGAAKSVVSTGTYADNAWHLATFTVQAGGSMYLYIDGVAQTPVAGIGSPYTGYTNSYWVIGRGVATGATNDAAGYFPGSLDDIRQFSSSLTPMDVLTIYNNTSNSAVFWGFGAEETPPSGASPKRGGILYFDD